MNPALLALTITGAIATGVLAIVLLYTTVLIRKTNIVMKKVDYLVEDLTYKAESLNVGVEAIRKISNYVLAADSFAKKGFSSIFKLVSQNKNFFYGLIDRLRSENTTKKAPAKSGTTKEMKVSVTKEMKKPVAKKAPAKKTTAKKVTK